jgi:prephenate dehydratase
MSKKVAIQGYAASFHDVAARKIFCQDIKILGCDTFADVFSCVINGQADYGVVAIENSNYGPISESTSLLRSQPVRQHKLVTVPIRQCLIGLPGASLLTIKQVHSHPVALAQCSEYLSHNLPYAQQRNNADTAGSVADIKRWNDVSNAAIVENDPNNETTFVSFS